VSPTPRSASVVVPCYNYARFVGAAIESALGQSRSFREVIVVEDGSTDGSRSVIERYGDRVRAVFKENGGQASAFNAGCRLARGDVVFLLDADDELCPEAVDTVLAAWRPGTVLLQSRPSLMDTEGRALPGVVPGPHVRLAEGDVRQQMVETGDLRVTVTSGLVVRRDALERVMPIPEERFRQGADAYVSRAVAFQGELQALDRPLSRYRRHGKNDTDIGVSPLQVAVAFRKRAALMQNELWTIREFARQQGLEVAEDLGEHNPDLLFLRLGSLVADPPGHSIPGDSRLGLLARILASSRAIPPGTASRARISLLATALAILPGRLGVRPLAWSLSPATRPRWLAGLSAWRRRLSGT